MVIMVGVLGNAIQTNVFPNAYSGQQYRALAHSSVMDSIFLGIWLMGALAVLK